MRFEFESFFKKISEINTMLEQNELTVDHSYQRKSIWTEKDEIRLIETILLNLVVPSVYFWNSDTDPDTGKTITHIVDGQQRITAIKKFIDGNLRLKTSQLLTPDACSSFCDKCFFDLDIELKKQFWEYRLSVIEIQRDVSLEHVKEMFKRLNLTDYNLNSQEKRHAQNGEFACLANDIAQNTFWEDNQLFTVNEIKRMKDVEFCANLIILSRKGIVDQTTDKCLNDAYTDYATGYTEAENDKQKILMAMDILASFLNEANKPFIKKTTQLYSLFSIIFYMIRENISISDEIVTKFNSFVSIYLCFKNEDNNTLSLESEERILYDQIKKYKQASSEGVRKLVNRMARFEVLKNYLFTSTYPHDIIESLLKKLEK